MNLSLVQENGNSDLRAAKAIQEVLVLYRNCRENYAPSLICCIHRCSMKLGSPRLCGRACCQRIWGVSRRIRRPPFSGSFRSVSPSLQSPVARVRITRSDSQVNLEVEDREHSAREAASHGLRGARRESESGECASDSDTSAAAWKSILPRWERLY